MDFWDNVMEGAQNAQPETLVALVTLAFIGLFLRGLVPFLRELNIERNKLATEQREFYEGEVMPTLKGLVSELKSALATQREQYEAKLSILEKERNAERDKLVEQINQLTIQVRTLTDRIEKLEAEGKTKDAEIERLKALLTEKQAELDAALAKLAAAEAGQHANDIKPAEGKPDEQSKAA